MAARAAAGRGRRRRRGGAEDNEDQERWLLTYADMITLLMALFMVLFSISSVNVSKFETLKEVLQDAFSPSVLQGGGGVAAGGGAQAGGPPQDPVPVPATLPLPLDWGVEREPATDGERSEQEDFRRLKRLLDGYARANGFEDSIETVIESRGLVIRVLTDRVLFDSGSAVLKSAATPLLAQIARLVNLDGRHPVSVEGHTDPVPISTARFPSNWELSGARAARVVRFMIERGVRAPRLEATGFADLHPIAPNASDAGRSRNRRVEIVLLRVGEAGQEGPTSP